jgi:predicted ferric reductase
VTALPLAGDPAALWYLNRVSGLVLLALFSASLLLGQLATVRASSDLVPRFVTLELHRNLTMVAVVLLGLHVTASVVDSYVDISPLDVVVPLRSPYRPVWLGLGTLAVDVLAAVAITSVLRHRISHSGWRAVHSLAYLAWPLAVLHGLGTGTDTRGQFTLLVTFVCIMLVVFGLLIRIATLTGLPRGARPALTLLVIAVPLLTSVWLRAGPLQPDWSRRAGTPPPAGSTGGVR